MGTASPGIEDTDLELAQRLLPARPTPRVPSPSQPLEQMTFAEIAASLGITRQCAEATARRAMRKLRNIIKQSGEEAALRELLR